MKAGTRAPNLDHKYARSRDQGFVDISAMTLNAVIKGSILADPEACFVMMMALPFSSTRAFTTAKSLFPRGHLAKGMDERPERVAG
jgi:hypothetical protein